MILLDTNVLIYSAERESPFHGWARETIAEAVAGEGAAINPVVLAEICVGDLEPGTVPDRIRSWGVAVLDLPAAAAPVCALAYSSYRKRREADSASVSRMPLPDFFIGAHAQTMGWALATADEGRFRTYFPRLTLRMPSF
jgi:predicted nucleic acid-binding protein